MQLRFIEKGMVLDITEETSNQDSGAKYKATLYRVLSDKVFLVESEELHQNFRKDTLLRIDFFRGASMYTLIGKAKGVAKDRNAYLTQIEQLSTIEVFSRRKYHREEIMMQVQLYEVNQESLSTGIWEMAGDKAVFSSNTLDVSTGGLCLVSNLQLNAPYEAHFLAEFSLGPKDKFLLPAKLIRKEPCRKTALFKYDYGFEFMLDHIPEEKERLATSLLNAKLDSVFGR